MKTGGQPCLVIVDSSIGRTGGFVCAQNMALALRDRMPAVLVVPREARFSQADLKPFLCDVRMELRAPYRALPAAWAWLAGLIPSGVQLRRLLAQTKATHLVLNDFYLLQGLICRLMGFRGQIITWVRLQPNRAGGRLTVLLWGLIGLSSDRVVAVSRFVKQQIPCWLQATVVYDCLAAEPMCDQLAARYGRFVYLGHLMPGKGQDHAVEAFAALAHRFPEAVLEFHGGTFSLPGNEEWKQRLQQRVRWLGLEQRITFHGPYDDPFPVLRGAYAVLNFSESETFSFTVLEAMAAGVPVISTRCGGPAEIVIDRLTGLMVPVCDRSAMGEAMAELLLSPSQTAAMGVAAANSVLERFTPQNYRDRILAILQLTRSANPDSSADCQPETRPSLPSLP
jgi:glycosyltransferase involved in cell wall biosynthesis